MPKNAALATVAGAASKVAAELRLRSSLSVCFAVGAAMPSVCFLRVVCGGQSVWTLWGQGEACYQVQVVGPEVQFLWPLPVGGRLCGDEGVIAVLCRVGAFHLDALGLAELCGELAHKCLAQCCSAVDAEAECSGVFDHARE